MNKNEMLKIDGKELKNENKILQFEKNAADNTSLKPERKAKTDENKLIRFQSAVRSGKFNPDEIFSNLDGDIKKGLMKNYMEAVLEDERTVPTHNLGFVDMAMWSRITEMHPEKSDIYPLNDIGFGEMFADLHSKRCRYNTTSGCWYRYDGTRWVKDNASTYTETCYSVFYNTLREYAKTISDEDERYRLSKKIESLTTRNKKASVLHNARTKYSITHDMFDKDENLLNVKNGTLDLTTYELKKHNPDDLISKICNVKFDFDAKFDVWDKFITEVTNGDDEKYDYLQRLLGYSLTAETTDEGCYILYGSSTRNGKSTLIETYYYMLGGSDGYARTIQPQTLAAKNQDSRQANGDIARLKGCRFLSCSEFPKRMVLDAALLKQITGRDTITARELYQAEIEFTPCYKLFINTNYLPQTGDTTLFDSNRVHIIEFNRHFTEDEQDKNLKETLRSPEILSGILNWCLAGLTAYRCMGLFVPREVKKSTNDYLEHCDKLGMFFDECMVKTLFNSSAGKVYEVYKIWCINNGYNCENKSNFFDELKRKGVFAKSGRVNGKPQQNTIKKYELKSKYSI